MSADNRDAVEVLFQRLESVEQVLGTFLGRLWIKPADAVRKTATKSKIATDPVFAPVYDHAQSPDWKLTTDEAALIV